jgi:hypothetical protein
MTAIGKARISSAIDRSSIMTEVEIIQDTLIVHVRGLDRLLALKSRLEIPLSHVLGAEADPQAASEDPKGLRLPASYVPGIITAGTFYRDGEWEFWDVHDPQKAIVIRLKDERYARLVVEVENPSATVAAIERALG